MLQSRKVCLNDLNPHLLCALCGGYFVDATTIIECLHSFCRTCIVRYLETSKYCPVCDVQVHKTKPLQNIRADQTLQDIVYKLVPGLFQREMQLRREFYTGHPESEPTSKEDAGEATDSYYFYSAEDQVSLALQYAPAPGQTNSELGKRYLRCPAAVTVAHLQKLLRAKHGLSAVHRVDLCPELTSQPLTESLTLMDVAYIHQWKRKGPILLYYQIYERPCKRRKLDTGGPITTSIDNAPSVVDSDSKENLAAAEQATSAAETSADTLALPMDTKPHPAHSPAAAVCTATSAEEAEKWTEVQLQISETGIMKVTNLVAPTVVAKETVLSCGKVDSPSAVRDAEEQKSPTPSTTVEHGPEEGLATEVSDINGNRKGKDPPAPTPTVADSEEPQKPAPPVKAVAVKKLETCPVPAETSKTPKPEVVATSSSPPNVEKKPEQPNIASKDSRKEMTASPVPIPKAVPPPPLGYKSLQFPPRTWDPSTSRTSSLSPQSVLSKSCPTPSSSSTTPVAKPDIPKPTADIPKPTSLPAQSKPPRFFKDRDRPRFLGNPLSGVKPMYPIQSEVKNKPASSMVKIDPKTLSPIVSKPAVTLHNNNHMSCSAVTSCTNTTTTTNARSVVQLETSRSAGPLEALRPPVPNTAVPSLGPILQPPPNPLLFNYPGGLMNPALLRPPLSPHHFPPYPLPQTMFYSPPHPKFPPSLPSVQRIPANIQAPKSPVPSATTPKSEPPKLNGDSHKKEPRDGTPEVAKPPVPQDVLSNGPKEEKKVVNGPREANSSDPSKTVVPISKPVTNNSSASNVEPSKPVPPALPAQNTK